jgi:hypothetical protein
MAKQIKSRRSRRSATRATSTFEVRQLWLAAIGAVSLSRKQGSKFYGTLLNEGRGLQDRVNDSIADVSGQVSAMVTQMRDRAESIVKPLRARADSAIATVKSEVETRAKPLMVRFGFAKKTPAKRRPAAKRVARKSATRRTAKRKAA